MWESPAFTASYVAIVNLVSRMSRRIRDINYAYLSIIEKRSTYFPILTALACAGSVAWIVACLDRKQCKYSLIVNILIVCTYTPFRTGGFPDLSCTIGSVRFDQKI